MLVVNETPSPPFGRTMPKDASPRAARTGPQKAAARLAPAPSLPASPSPAPKTGSPSPRDTNQVGHYLEPSRSHCCGWNMPRTAIVAGTKYKNRDGSSRAQLIRKHCCNGTLIKLVLEPGNPHAANAIAVYMAVRRLFRRRFDQIGYIRAGATVRRGAVFRHASMFRQRCAESRSSGEGLAAHQIRIPSA